MVPSRAIFISVRLRQGRLDLWAIVNPIRNSEARKIWVIPTGAVPPVGFEDLPVVEQLARFIGTVMTEDQSLIFHVFG